MTIRGMYHAAGAMFLRHKHPLLFLVGGLVLHFWYIFLRFREVLYGGPGDHTAGLIWLYEQYPSSPWWGFTARSGAPFGENLWDPSFVLSQAIYIPFWICAQLTGSGIGGYNLLTILGFILSFIGIYWTSRRLTQTSKIFAAAIAYAVSFSPFVLFLDGVGHLSYIIAPAFVASIIYLFFTFNNGRKAYKAAGLGLLVGLSWIIDPYFLLFSGLLLGGLLLGGLVVAVGRGGKGLLGTYGRYVLLAGLTMGAGVVPLGIYTVANNDSVAGTLSVRSDIMHDAQQYSARFADYLLPSAQNPFIPEAVKRIKLDTYHGQNPTFTLYLGISLMIGLVGGLATLVYFRYNELALEVNRVDKIIILSVCAIVLFIFSLPPKIEILGLNIPGPSGLIVSLVAVWRVFARLYIFLLPVLGLLFLLIWTEILRLSSPKSRRYIHVGLVVLLVCLMLEYLPRNPLDKSLYWSVTNVPETYQTVKNDENISVLAEYPFREAPHYRGSTYFSAQLYHEKRLFNSVVANSDKTLLRESLMDLKNPQTLRSLQLLGVDGIHIWSNPTQNWVGEEIAGYELSGNSLYHNMFGKGMVYLYTLKKLDPAPLSRYVAHLDVDSRMTNGEFVYNVAQTVPEVFRIRVYDLCSDISNSVCGTKAKVYRINFTLRNDDIASKTITITNGVNVEYFILPPKGYKEVSRGISANASGSIKVESDNSQMLYVSNQHVQGVEWE